MSNLDSSGFVTIPRLEKIPFLIHGFGRGDFSIGHFEDLAALHGMTPVTLRQVHSVRIHDIHRIPGKQLEGDAMITGRTGFLLAVRTADCLPLLLVSEETKVVAVVHCGWRGTAQNISGKVVAALASRYNTAPRKLLAVMGPCIETDCYEVGAEVRDRFPREFRGCDVFSPIPGRPGKLRLDLRRANHLILAAAGVPEENIFSLPHCTYCRSELISYRREPGCAGRLVNFIGMAY